MSEKREPFSAGFLHYGCAEHLRPRVAADRRAVAMTYFAQQPAEEIAPKLVGFVGVNRTSSFDLLGSLEAFAAARVTEPNGQGRQCYEPIVIGAEGKTFVTSAGAVIKAHHTIRSAPALDTIIVPGGNGLRNTEVARKLAEWLGGRANTTRRIAATSEGIYPLASTGLLNGREATTHWRLARDVSRMFPSIAIKNAVSFVSAGRFYTCGGGVAGVEMSLALIEEDFGAKTALAVARELSIDLRKPGAAPEIAIPEHQPGPAERLAELPTWITSRLHRDLTVEVLAERAGLSPRHFYRLFKETFKCTPAAFVEQLRINEAQRRLAAQRENVESVANSLGFKSPAVFRRAFGRQLGYPPSRVLRAEAKRRAR
jgi:transcriptional regulator GlxA family with amidase domain